MRKKAKTVEGEGLGDSSTEGDAGHELLQSQTEAGDEDQDELHMHSGLDDVKMSLFLSEDPAREELLRDDQVHGEISLPRDVWSLCETSAMKRLAHLEQLGACSHVFPLATHTRLQHSIGVCYLAKLMLEAIAAQVERMHSAAPRGIPQHTRANSKAHLPGLVSRQDKLCVMVAALAHDAGHGPKSHLFEHVVKECFRDEEQFHGTEWSHEAESARMVRQMLEENRERNASSSLSELEERDVTFICECIVGKDLHELPEHASNRKTRSCCSSTKACELMRRGRDRSKAYLYDIVSNIHSGLDVDKIDYLMRDPSVFGGASQVSSFAEP
jgi:HD superfamily phosphohydrolase